MKNVKIILFAAFFMASAFFGLDALAYSRTGNSIQQTITVGPSDFSPGGCTGSGYAIWCMAYPSGDRHLCFSDATPVLDSAVTTTLTLTEDSKGADIVLPYDAGALVLGAKSPFSSCSILEGNMLDHIIFTLHGATTSLEYAQLGMTNIFASLYEYFAVILYVLGGLIAVYLVFWGYRKIISNF